MGDNDWKHGMFGCFDNCGLCIWTFFCPCIGFGKNAAALDKSCCLYTCFYFIPIWNIYQKVKMRGEIRDKQGIDGTCCGDLLWSLLCGFCTFVQERQECVESLGAEAMARE